MTWMAYHCMHKLHWKPSEYIYLPRKEKAIVHALIRERIKREKEEQSRMKTKGKARGLR